MNLLSDFIQNRITDQSMGLHVSIIVTKQDCTKDILALLYKKEKMAQVVDIESPTPENETQQQLINSLLSNEVCVLIPLSNQDILSSYFTFFSQLRESPLLQQTASSHLFFVVYNEQAEITNPLFQRIADYTHIEHT